MKIKRGEIYYADLKGAIGSEQGGIRPVVVLQNDKGNRFSKTIIVAPISTKLQKPPLPTHVYVPSFLLQRSSMILLEQLRTIDQCRLSAKITMCDEDTLKKIDEALCISLGIEKNE